MPFMLRYEIINVIFLSKDDELHCMSVTKCTIILCWCQALTDQQQFGKADEMYDKCIELEPDNATTYVHKG